MIKEALEKQLNEAVMRERFDQIVKDIVIKAAMEKETIVRQSVKELLREVLEEMKQTDPQDVA